MKSNEIKKNNFNKIYREKKVEKNSAFLFNRVNINKVSVRKWGEKIEKIIKIKKHF